MDRKAFIFTLDAIMALILAALIVSAIYFNFSKQSQQPYSEANLLQISLDSLTVLEKNSNLNDAVQNNDLSQLQSFVTIMPYQFCSNITIKDSDEDYIASIQRNCSLSNPQAIARRIFIANNTVFLAEMKTSFK